MAKKELRQSVREQYQSLSAEERSQLYRKRIAYQRKYKEEHKEERKAYFRHYYQEHKEEMMQKSNDRRLLRRAIKITGSGEPIDRVGLYQRDRGMCGICRKRVARSQMSIDHIVPISRGGTHTWDNVQLAHTECNRRRNDGLLPSQLHLNLPNRKRQSNYRLNPDAAKLIRRRTKPVSELARDFGVAVRTIYDVLEGRSWSNV